MCRDGKYIQNIVSSCTNYFFSSYGIQSSSQNVYGAKHFFQLLKYNLNLIFNKTKSSLQERIKELCNLCFCLNYIELTFIAFEKCESNVPTRDETLVGANYFNILQ